MDMSLVETLSLPWTPSLLPSLSLSHTSTSSLLTFAHFARWHPSLFFLSLSPSLILTPPFHIARTYSSCYP